MFKHALLLACMSLFLVVGTYAQKMNADAKHAGKVTVIVTHEVKDYAAWRKGFDAHGSVRAKAGFTVHGVYCDLKNANWVTIVGEFPSAAAAEDFFASKDLQETMAAAGVIGKPDLKVLTMGAK